jgi:hypothetical protein
VAILSLYNNIFLAFWKGFYGRIRIKLQKVEKEREKWRKMALTFLRKNPKYKPGSSVLARRLPWASI